MSLAGFRIRRSRSSQRIRAVLARRRLFAPVPPAFEEGDSSPLRRIPGSDSTLAALNRPPAEGFCLESGRVSLCCWHRFRAFRGARRGGGGFSALVLCFAKCLILRGLVCFFTKSSIFAFGVVDSFGGGGHKPPPDAETHTGPDGEAAPKGGGSGRETEDWVSGLEIVSLGFYLLRPCSFSLLVFGRDMWAAMLTG